ncbi:hypothetical protein TeGR_g10450, partial [Tetraparma gracilis]
MGGGVSKEAQEAARKSSEEAALAAQAQSRMLEKLLGKADALPPPSQATPGAPPEPEVASAEEVLDLSLSQCALSAAEALARCSRSKKRARLEQARRLCHVRHALRSAFPAGVPPAVSAEPQVADLLATVSLVSCVAGKSLLRPALFPVALSSLQVLQRLLLLLSAVLQDPLAELPADDQDEAKDALKAKDLLLGKLSKLLAVVRRSAKLRKSPDVSVAALELRIAASQMCLVCVPPRDQMGQVFAAGKAVAK